MPDPIKQKKSKAREMSIKTYVNRFLEKSLVIRLKEAYVNYFLDNRIFNPQELIKQFKDPEKTFHLVCAQVIKKDIENKKRIKWNGTQKELAELLIELGNKGWIGGMEFGNVKEFASVASSTFEFKKKPSSNTKLSFYQLLKPQQSKDENYVSTYPQIFTKRYIPKFNEIKKRKENS